MVTYSTLSTQKRPFLAMTGLTPAEFRDLLQAFEAAYERAYPPDQTADGRARQRWLGAGRRSALERAEDKLLFILVYQKAYPLQELLGSLFGLSQSQANRWVHRLLPLLVRALDRLGFLPERDPTRFSARERRHGEPPELIVDGSERRRHRYVAMLRRRQGPGDHHVEPADRPRRRRDDRPGQQV